MPSASSQKFLHSTFQRRLIARITFRGVCHPAGFQKLKEGLLDNSAYGYTNYTHITISSRVRRLPQWLPRSNDLFLTYLTLGRCISEILDLSFVFETGWHMDWMALWSGVWLREMVFACGFVSFFLSLHMISRFLGA